MTITTKPLTEAKVKVRDAELEAKASSGLLPLMKFRHDQTIGAGDQGYSFREYARIIGRHMATVARSANGYVIHRDQVPRAAAALTPLDAYELAHASEPERIAIVAAADAAQVTPAEARRARVPVVKVAKQAARQAVDQAIAEGKPEEEVETIARTAAQKAVVSSRQDLTAKREQVKQREAAAQKDPGYANWSRMEGHLLKARRALGEALPLARDADWSGEFLEFLQDDLAKVRALVGHIELALSGDTDIDWDAELQRLTANREA